MAFILAISRPIWLRYMMKKTDDRLVPTCPPEEPLTEETFADRPRAIAFFKSHLPPGIAAKADWASLTELPWSFTELSPEEDASDLLFKVNIGGRDALLYLVFVHQSAVDEAMPLRMLYYISQLLSRYVEENGLPLAPVLPFVIHQGAVRWNTSPAFEDLFDLPVEVTETLMPYLPKFQHTLITE
jgi:predicted transposase/invertase (TIGR01784 family)